VIASGVAVVALGEVAKETDAADPDSAGSHRVPSERAARALADRSVRSAVVRLAPTVHGEGDHGFVPAVIDIARTTGVSVYIGDGENRWPTSTASTLFASSGLRSRPHPPPPCSTRLVRRECGSATSRRRSDAS
jgi:hypothetical protein